MQVRRGAAVELLNNLVGGALADIGNVACAVWEKAVGSGLEIAAMAIPGVGEAATAEKAAVTALKQAMKAGGKSGIIRFCGKYNKFRDAVNNAISI